MEQVKQVIPPDTYWARLKVNKCFEGSSFLVWGGCVTKDMADWILKMKRKGVPVEICKVGDYVEIESVKTYERL